MKSSPLGPHPKSALQPRKGWLHRTVLRACCALVVAGSLASAARAEESASGRDAALFSRVQAAATVGNPALKYHLAMLLNNGIGTARDLPRAYALFHEAAAGGDALAAYKVGCYLAGQFPGVVPLDLAQALVFKQRAAEAGYELAQHDVGVLLLRRGDLQAATSWLTQASRQGYTASTALLARMADEAGQDPVRALGLALVLQSALQPVPAALQARIQVLEAGLDDEGRRRAESLQAGWLAGPTPLTRQARAGMRAVLPLLTTSAAAAP